MKVLFIGNCHVNPISLLLAKSTSDCEIDRIQWRNNMSFTPSELTLLNSADIVGVISTFYEQLLESLGKDWPGKSKIQKIPHIRGRKFHPDLVYIKDLSGGDIRTPLARCNSAIAVFSYINGIDVEQAVTFYNEEVYRLLGYFNAEAKDLNWLKYQEEETGYQLLKQDKVWIKRGCYFHTPNHPILNVFSSIVLQFAKYNSIEIVYDKPDILMEDRAARQAIWPVYPEIAKQFGIDGSYLFKVPDVPLQKGGGNKLGLKLEEFVAASYDVYNCVDIKVTSNPQLERVFHGIGINDLINATGRNNQKIKSNNPYNLLPDYCFWKRSISNVQISQVDPVVEPKYIINKGDNVATAGSCFAQHISRALTKEGFTWLETEKPDVSMTEDELDKYGYGIFTARYGNIYTVRQLLQLYDRAFGRWGGDDKPWRHLETDAYIDPFRPYIQQEFFPDYGSYESDLNRHLSSVREMFEKLDVFVFTLGLTEAWVRVSDGAVVPFHPGVVGAQYEPHEYVFKNFSLGEVSEDLAEFKNRLFKLNPKAKMLITVSPVPLIATYEKSHVLVSTTYSKSVLRVAAQEICNCDERVAYFPSYEIITSHYNNGTYYHRDKREVKKAGVDHVMKLLIKHYMQATVEADHDDLEQASVVCDEENIEN